MRYGCGKGLYPDRRLESFAEGQDPLACVAIWVRDGPATIQTRARRRRRLPQECCRRGTWARFSILPSALVTVSWISLPQTVASCSESWFSRKQISWGRGDSRPIEEDGLLQGVPIAPYLWHRPRQNHVKARRFVETTSGREKEGRGGRGQASRVIDGPLAKRGNTEDGIRKVKSPAGDRDQLVPDRFMVRDPETEAQPRTRLWRVRGFESSDGREAHSPSGG